MSMNTDAFCSQFSRFDDQATPACAQHRPGDEAQEQRGADARAMSRETALARRQVSQGAERCRREKRAADEARRVLSGEVVAGETARERQSAIAAISARRTPAQSRDSNACHAVSKRTRGFPSRPHPGRPDRQLAWARNIRKKRLSPPSYSRRAARCGRRGPDRTRNREAPWRPARRCVATRRAPPE